VRDFTAAIDKINWKPSFLSPPNDTHAIYTYVGLHVHACVICQQGRKFLMYKEWVYETKPRYENL
jgi:hypothetical protein